MGWEIDNSFWRFGYSSYCRTSNIDSHTGNYWLHIIGPFFYMIKRGKK